MCDKKKPVWGAFGAWFARIQRGLVINGQAVKRAA
jgi:hypothetical protein